ncbi:hypothetical protein TNCV_4524831 [Trichonephila clavipes]|nr:hypothetical protein TNCV_4524831 [Trichonephila clavipes]
MDDNARPHRTLAVEEMLESEDITRMCHSNLVVKALDRGWHVTSSSQVPLKTRRVGKWHVTYGVPVPKRGTYLLISIDKSSVLSRINGVT